MRVAAKQELEGILRDLLNSCGGWQGILVTLTKVIHLKQLKAVDGNTPVAPVGHSHTFAPVTLAASPSISEHPRASLSIPRKPQLSWKIEFKMRNEFRLI